MILLSWGCIVGLMGLVSRNGRLYGGLSLSWSVHRSVHPFVRPVVHLRCVCDTFAFPPSRSYLGPYIRSCFCKHIPGTPRGGGKRRGLIMVADVFRCCGQCRGIGLWLLRSVIRNSAYGISWDRPNFSRKLGFPYSWCGNVWGNN